MGDRKEYGVCGLLRWVRDDFSSKVLDQVGLDEEGKVGATEDGIGNDPLFDSTRAATFQQK